LARHTFSEQSAIYVQSGKEEIWILSSHGRREISIAESTLTGLRMVSHYLDAIFRANERLISLIAVVFDLLS
jgi:hypothetical protein